MPRPVPRPVLRAARVRGKPQRAKSSTLDSQLDPWLPLEGASISPSYGYDASSRPIYYPITAPVDMSDANYTAK